MKKIARILCLSACTIVMNASLVLAHDFWLNVNESAADKKASVEIGYGHSFPAPEAISEERISLFDAPILCNENGPVPLEQGKVNYEFKSKEALKKGSYIAAGTYKPTMWSKDTDGKWFMKNKKETPNVDTCEQYTRFAKNIINVGGAADNFVVKPIGHALEIVPLANPATAKVGEPFPLLVLFDGKPRLGAQVKATFSGFSKNEESKAFFGVTNKKGEVNFVPLKDGYWVVTAEYGRTYPDQTLCDKDNFDASLAFQINK